MRCPTCQKAMQKIDNDVGIGVMIQSFYCQKCDTSYTDRESVEEAMERVKFNGKKTWIVSQLKFRGAAS